MNGFVKILRNITATSVCGVKIRRNPLRCIHYNQKLFVKIYLEHENHYAYSLLENKGYAVNLTSDTVYKPLHEEQVDSVLREDWSKMTPQQLFDIFPKLGIYCAEKGLSISNKMFDTYFDNLTDNIKFASDKELETLFHMLDMWPPIESVKTRNYIEIWAALDDECLNRMNKWTFEQSLTYAALFYKLNIVRLSDFMNKLLLKLAYKAKRLTLGQLVQTLFFIGIQRRPPIDMHNIEVQVNERFSEFSIDDLSIMAMGFFKSKTPIRDQYLVSKTIKKLTENAKQVHEVSLAALLKLIRYSAKLIHSDELYEMLDALEPELSRLSVMCRVHVALVGTTTLTLHEQCLNRVAEAVGQSMKDARLKDLERLALTFAMFNYKPLKGGSECFLQKIIKELRSMEREPEIMRYGRAFACCVSYLGYLEMYPEDLIAKCFDQELLETTYGKHPYQYGREILSIQNTVEIFCPHYNVKLLNENAVVVMAKKYTDYVPDESYPGKTEYNANERVVLDVLRLLREHRGGHDYVLGDHILSHHQKGGK